MGIKRHVLCLSGAGISADSGVATFRGAGGLWEGHRVEEVATPEAWRRDPELVWRFYQMRRASLGTVEPNPGHDGLVLLEQTSVEAGSEFTLITQNVDDLHERAGSRNLLHMHGELAVLKCEICGSRVRDLEHVEPEVFVSCASCGHERLRPDIVWFGEMPYHLDRIEQALMRCTDFLAIGTSGVVHPAAGFLELARARGANTWVLALERPENCHSDDRYVEGPARETVPRVVRQIVRDNRWGP